MSEHQMRVVDFDPPRDIADVVALLRDDPDAALWFPHERQRLYVYQSPGEGTQWAKRRAGTNNEIPITSGSLADRLRSDEPEYEHEIVKDVAAHSPGGDGQ